MPLKTCPDRTRTIRGLCLFKKYTVYERTPSLPPFSRPYTMRFSATPDESSFARSMAMYSRIRSLTPVAASKNAASPTLARCMPGFRVPMFFRHSDIDENPNMGGDGCRGRLQQRGKNDYRTRFFPPRFLARIFPRKNFRVVSRRILLEEPTTFRKTKRSIFFSVAGNSFLFLPRKTQFTHHLLNTHDTWR